MMDKFFETRCVTYKIDKLCKSKLSILFLFFFSYINIFFIKLVSLLESIYSAMVDFVLNYQLFLQFNNFFLILRVDPRRYLN